MLLCGVVLYFQQQMLVLFWGKHTREGLHNATHVAPTILVSLPPHTNWKYLSCTFDNCYIFGEETLTILICWTKTWVAAETKTILNPTCHCITMPSKLQFSQIQIQYSSNKIFWQLSLNDYPKLQLKQRQFWIADGVAL